MPKDPELTVEVTLRAGDIYQPFLYSWSNLMRWASALFACYLIYTTRSIWLAGSQPDTAFTLAGPPLFCAFVFIVIFSWPYLRVRSMFHKYPALGHSRRVSFSAEGMHIDSQEAQGDYKWSLFYQIVETPKTFLFIPTERGGVYIPKRCLSKADDILTLRRLIRDNFTGKCRLRSE